MSSKNDILEYVYKGLMAGLAIGMGCVVYASWYQTIEAAVMFSFGIMACFVFEWNLFTGKICQPSVMDEHFSSYMSGILILNVIGIVIFCALCGSTRLYDEAAMTIVAAKIEKGFWRMYVGGIICEIAIAFCVKIWEKYCRNGNCLWLISLAICTFICGKGEHFIANIGYYTLGFRYIVSLDETGFKTFFTLLGTLFGNFTGAVLMWKSMKKR